MTTDAPIPNSTALDINPRISRYLETNDQIDPADSLLIHEDMARLLKARVELEKRMVAIQNGLNGLDAAIQSRKAVLAPIRLLSDDILGAIFMWCTPSSASDLDETPDSLDVFRWPPWILSHVCRRWRKTALAHKRLWSTIALFLTSYSDGGSSLQLFKTILQRAAPCELALTIDHAVADESDSYLFFRNHFQEIMQATTPQIRILHVPTPDYVVHLLAGNPLHGLECLQLTYRRGFIHLQNPPARSPLFTMPRLHTLVYEFAAVPFHGLSLPWAQLKNVFLGYSKTEVLELLADTGLEVLALRHSRHEANHSVPHRTFTFPKLHTLWLDGNSEEMYHFFALVCGPKLKTLKIALDDTFFMSGMFLSVVHYPGVIERLDVACKNLLEVTADDLNNRFFKPLSNVRECYVALPAQAMRALFSDLSADNLILPCLRILRLSADGLDRYMDELSRAIAARKDMHNAAKLAAVEVSLLKNTSPGWDDTESSDGMVSLARLRELLDCDVRMYTHLEDDAPWNVLPPFASCEIELDPTELY
ncbi:hypothetical protein CYLTODRAFT_492761 [Cylindrobasidium torrendii FP15055 ss-10]|uniref:F-box domain-containing protein n=1 Tax=Cylindrobasidium torrendii FP15055 ss-10 TaxID=1314674 RepID=A0A0D7B2S0_9AGAR|nr:hypothetical protein CYLTODRAFT_492761 [Cylindrobasidium torrendii FP15055 ss-10]